MKGITTEFIKNREKKEINERRGNEQEKQNG